MAGHFKSLHLLWRGLIAGAMVLASLNPCCVESAEPAPAAVPAVSPPNPFDEKVYAEIREIKLPGGKVVDVAETLKHLTRPRFSREPIDVDDELLDTYFRCRIAQLTWRENLDSLPKKREEFKKTLRHGSSDELNSVTHAQLTKPFLSQLPELISNAAYHPAVRVNATLLLGDLNEKEPQPADLSAIPHRSASGMLLKLLGDETLPDEIRVAAVVGVMRRINAKGYELKQEELQQIIAVCRDLVNPQADAKTKARPGMIWLQRQACMALGFLALKSDEVREPEVALDVLALIRDDEADLETRCRAANTLGLLRTRNAPADYGGDAACALAELTLDVCQKMRVARPDVVPVEPQPAKTNEDPRHYIGVEISNKDGTQRTSSRRDFTAESFALKLTCIGSCLRGLVENADLLSNDDRTTKNETREFMRELVRAFEGKPEANAQLLVRKVNQELSNFEFNRKLGAARTVPK